MDLDSGMVLGYIRGGKGGKKLGDERYIVEQFGPILTVHAIGAMAHDVHKHYKSCIDAREYDDADEDEVDGEEEELDKMAKAGLDELKGAAEKLVENLTLEADKVLTVKEVCVKIDDGQEGISVEWFVYNPEEKMFYTDYKGDIEYHVKVAITVTEGEDFKVIPIYDSVFLDKITNEEEASSPMHLKNEDLATNDAQQARDDSVGCSSYQNVAKAAEHGLMEASPAENADAISESPLSSEIYLNSRELADHLSQHQEQQVKESNNKQEQHHSKESSNEALEGRYDSNTSEIAGATCDEQKTQQLQGDIMEVTGNVQEQQLKGGTREAFKHKRADEQEFPHLDDKSNEVPTGTCDKQAVQQHEGGTEALGDQNIKEDATELSGGEDDDEQAELQSDKSTTDYILKERKLVSFQVKDLDPSVLKNVVYTCVSIQPKVTLQVKMLPPDKIATEEYRIDRQRLEEGDTLWMDDVKKEIEENGRVNEVTLQGQRVSEQQPTKLSGTDSKVQFTAQCHHEAESLTVFGSIEPVPDAKHYLVNLVDETDLTIIIKQCRVFSSDLHYKIEAVNSDFPESSSGPYCISVVALAADFSICSSFTNSEFDIPRYCPPVCLTETLPSLDAGTSDTVKLEWKHSKLNENDNSSVTPENVPEPDNEKNKGDDVSVESDTSAMPESNTSLSQSKPESLHHFYMLTITGVRIKKPTESKKQKIISMDNVDDSEETFIISVPIHTKEETAGYEFSLANILKEGDHQIQDGVHFQCKVFTNGISKLHSVPKSFSEFILLAPPMDLKVTTPKRNAGLHLSWEYSMHAIGYRMELVCGNEEKKAFTKVLKCETGSHGEAILLRDFKDIPYTSPGKGYRLQMYSLGFGQELIRCLKPSIAKGIFHKIPAKLQYFCESSRIRVQFIPFPDVRADFVVELCRIKDEDSEEPLHLTARHVYDHEAQNEAIVDFSLKRCWHLLQSGDSVVAWVCSTAKSSPGVSYIGVPQEEVCVLNSPKLEISAQSCLDSTVLGVQLSWSKVAKAEKYQYGYYLPDNKKHITIMETQEMQAIVEFSNSMLPDLFKNSCEFHMYVTALGKPGVLVTGEVTLDPTRFQCIKYQFVNESKVVIFTTVNLQCMWQRQLTDFAVRQRCFPVVPNTPPHLLFPSGAPFPDIRIPSKFMKKFWKSECSLFGIDNLYARDILNVDQKAAKSQNEWKKVNPFSRPFKKSKKTCFSELRLLFYTRCSRESSEGKKTLEKVDIEIKIEKKTKKTKKTNEKRDTEITAKPVATTAAETSKPAIAATIEDTEASTEDKSAQSQVPSKTDEDSEDEEAFEIIDDPKVKEQDSEDEESHSIESTVHQAPLEVGDSKMNEQDEESRSTEPILPRAGPEMNEQEPKEKIEAITNEGLKTDDEISSMQGKSQGSEGWLKSGMKSAASRVRSVVGGAKSMVVGGVTGVLGGAISALKGDSTVVVYSKKVSIHLPPGGRGAKTHCLLVTYKPIDCYEPLITVKVNPSKRCHHDTHLFVRFAGYYSKQQRNTLLPHLKPSHP